MVYTGKITEITAVAGVRYFIQGFKLLTFRVAGFSIEALQLCSPFA